LSREDNCISSFLSSYDIMQLICKRIPAGGGGGEQTTLQVCCTIIIQISNKNIIYIISTPDYGVDMKTSF